MGQDDVQKEHKQPNLTRLMVRRGRGGGVLGEREGLHRRVVRTINKGAG